MVIDRETADQQLFISCGIPPDVPGRYSGSMYSIEIANEQTLLNIDDPLLEDVARQTLSAEQVAAAEISIALVDNVAIHEINRQYLQHDFATDVISFLLDEFGPEDGAAPEAEPSTGFPTARGAGKTLSGEVIISTEMAADMARDYGWQARDEVILYLVHGLLHLCGYDDLSADEQRVMRAREVEILARWNLVPHYAADPVD